MEDNKPKPGTRIRYFPCIWSENDFHDGTIIDEEGRIVFDDGYKLTEMTDESGTLILSDDDFKELGINYDEQNNQFTRRKEAMPPDEIALAVAENRIVLAYEVASGEFVWLQKDNGEQKFETAEKTKGYKFAGDKSLPFEVQSKMMRMIGQLTDYIARHGLKKRSK